jgi:succinate dehydrogenase / fumarate reductase cytochrome b subunit
MENRRARPVDYHAKATAGGATLASRTMAIGGVVLAFFVITHVKMFKYGDQSNAEGLWGLVVHTFHNPLVVAWYLLAMGALGLHLSHGFSSAFQTLGAGKPAWRTNLRRAGFALGWLIAIGFMSFPVWSFLHNDPIH